MSIVRGMQLGLLYSVFVVCMVNAASLKTVDDDYDYVWLLDYISMIDARVSGVMRASFEQCWDNIHMQVLCVHICYDYMR